MGPAPKKPDPLSTIPQPGFENPMYPTIGKKEPTGTVRSQVDVSKTFGPALSGLVGDVVNPSRVVGRAIRDSAPGILSSLSGDASRQAASQAMVDTTRNALRQSMEDVNQKQVSQAEKSRGEDVLAQRQSFSDYWRGDKLFNVYGVDIRADFVQKVKELAAYYEREKKNSEAMVTAAMMRMFGGI